MTRYLRTVETKYLYNAPLSSFQHLQQANQKSTTTKDNGVYLLPFQDIYVSFLIDWLIMVYSFYHQIYYSHYWDLEKSWYIGISALCFTARWM